MDNLGAYVKHTGASDAGYLNEALIIADIRWTSNGKELRALTGTGRLTPWMSAGLFELVNKLG
tara:strand:- start:461 stop:649 length:189 start_codon:yes stop_codon:yes gene_type:complete